MIPARSIVTFRQTRRWWSAILTTAALSTMRNATPAMTRLYAKQRPFETLVEKDLIAFLDPLRLNTERARLLNAADVAFLCLPDAAAREAVAMVNNPRTCVIDASTAHRVDPAWAFGLPEMAPDQREHLRRANPAPFAGLLAWDVPAGHWTVFAMWLRPTEEAEESVPVMDHFSADAAWAVGAYVEEHMIGPENLDMLREVGGSFFEDSLEIDAEEVRVVYKISPLPFAEGPERGRLQDCGRRGQPDPRQYLPRQARSVRRGARCGGRRDR